MEPPTVPRDRPHHSTNLLWLALLLVFLLIPPVGYSVHVDKYPVHYLSGDREGSLIDKRPKSECPRRWPQGNSCSGREARLGKRVSADGLARFSWCFLSTKQLLKAAVRIATDAIRRELPSCHVSWRIRFQPESSRPWGHALGGSTHQTMLPSSDPAFGRFSPESFSATLSEGKKRRDGHETGSRMSRVHVSSYWILASAAKSVLTSRRGYGSYQVMVALRARTPRQLG